MVNLVLINFLAEHEYQFNIIGFMWTAVYMCTLLRPYPAHVSLHLGMYLLS